MNCIALAAVIAALGSAASAQQANFSYVGEIVSLQDDLGIFADSTLGDTVTGVFAFNPTQSPFFDIPAFLSVLAGESISAQIAGISYVSDDPEGVVVLLANDFSSIQNPNADASTLVDSLVIGSAVPNLENTTYGSVEAFFEGETNWFEGPTLPDIGTFGLGNLLRAEVVIEFQRLEDFDGVFDPLNPPTDFVVTRSVATVRITSIANNNGTIATIGCQALQFAAPVAQRDFFDVTAFLASFSANEARADLAEPAGVLNFLDVAEFLRQFNSSCSN